MSTKIPSTIVDTPEAIRALLEKLKKIEDNKPRLFIDLEGVKLSRHGTISIMELLLMPENRVYIIDVHVLGKSTFDTESEDKSDISKALDGLKLADKADKKNEPSITLKTILESKEIRKIFFDVRNDSDALFAHYDIRLQGVQDLQLMELATRRQYVSRKCVSGLAKCIEYDSGMPYQAKTDWKCTKDAGRKLFEPNLGGSYEVFNQRPLRADILEYCVRDVQYLSKLWEIYNAKLTPEWRKKVDEESGNRVALSQSASYDRHGPDKALSPWLNPTPQSSTGQPVAPRNSPGKTAGGVWAQSSSAGWKQFPTQEALDQHNDNVLDEWRESLLEDDVGFGDDDSWWHDEDDDCAQDFEDWTGNRSS